MALVRLFFRIVYGFVYTFLHILVVALLLVSPADIVNQARQRKDFVPIIIVSVGVVTTVLVVASVFFARLLINRAVLNSIPRSWLPVGKGDVHSLVRKMIAAGLSRSAAIAFVSRPRVVAGALHDIRPLLVDAGEGADADDKKKRGFFARRKQKHAQQDEASQGIFEKDEPDAPALDGHIHLDNLALNNTNLTANTARTAHTTNTANTPKLVRFKRVETVEKERELGIDLPPCLAVWGDIEHPGWAPPTQPLPGAAPADLGVGVAAAIDAGEPTLQYSTVLVELPALIEAKALTLAPPDPTSHAQPPLLDPDAVELLQRPAYMGLREYLSHLAALGVLDPSDDGTAPDGDDRPLSVVLPSFVAAYEHARFAAAKLAHAPFQQLMRDLATILRRMQPLNPDLLLDDDTDGDGYSGYEKEYSHAMTDTDNDADIDDNAAPSLPSTPIRQYAYHHQQQQQHILRHPSGASFVSSSSSSGSARSIQDVDPRQRSVYLTAHSSTHQASTGDLVPPRRRPHRRQPVRTAPSSSSSTNSFAQSRNPYTATSQPSTASLHSVASVAAASVARSASSASLASGSGSVIIRLADRDEQTQQGLPYILTRPG